MAKFVVQYSTSTGRLSTTVVEASSERGAVAKVEAEGHTPISARPATGAAKAAQSEESTKKGKRVRGPKGGKAMRRAVLDFTHQMAAVTESGIPIIAGIKAVAEQTEHAQLRAALIRVAARIEGGRNLADALDAEPDVFPALYAKTLAAGEAAGKVPEVLSALAGYQEQEAETRSQIKSAMMYPALVVTALFLATVFMLILVIPQFAKLFEKFEGELPLPTKILTTTSGVLIDHYLLVLGGVAALIFGIRTLFQYQFARTWLDNTLLRLPIFGTLFVGVHMTRFIDLLDLLMRAALPITQSLRVTADSVTNEGIRADVRRIGHAVEGGHSLTEGFNETRWVTPLVKRMLAIGEQAGRTDQVFAFLRKYYQNQTKRSVKMLSTLIEPVMVTSLAAVVLFFALSIFLPMWRLLKIVGTA